MLSHHGFCIAFDSHKVILSKDGTFIGKGCVKDMMYLLSIMNNNFVNSSYVFDAHDTLHYTLGHISRKLDRKINLRVSAKTCLHLNVNIV